MHRIPIFDNDYFTNSNTMINKRITIRDIAKEAGVSIGTVDRVLHDRGEVAAATRDKILELAEEFNYKPNAYARALTSRRVYTLAVLLPAADDDEIYWAGHLAGIRSQAQALEEYGLKVSVTHFALNNESDFSNQANNIIDAQPDGVIFAPIFKKESQLFAIQLDALDIPYLFIDTYIDDTNCVGFIGEDAFQSGRVAASIIDFGLSPERDILMVNIAKDLENTQHLTSRNQGFLSYFLDEGRNAGMRISIEIPTTDAQTVNEKLQKILDSNSNIGAIWVSGAKTYVIARYLETVNRRDIILVGYEVYNNNTEYLCRNFIKYLIAQQPAEQGAKTIQTMYNFLTEHTRPLKLEYQKVEIVNSENVRFFIGQH